MSKHLLKPLILVVAFFVQPAGAVSVIADAVAQMPANSWQKINLNSFASVMTPVGQRTDLYRPLSQIYAWTGAAWDASRDSMYVWGSDYNGHESNEVYVFNAGSGLWSRGSLPSQITTTNGFITTVDGVNNAPTAGETYDNLVFLSNVDRLGVIGVSRDGQTWQTTTGQATGPYFWDPAKADPNKVGGLTGSQVNPATYPTVTGGQMWQNRNNGGAINSGFGKQSHGTTDVVTVNGKDVVYVTDEYHNLWRYTVNDLDPANDTWQMIGGRTMNGEAGWGSAAIDTHHNIYLTSLLTGAFGFWDLAKPGGASVNREIKVIPTLLDTGITAPDFRNFGIEFDPLQNAFTLWDGSSYIWLLRPPSVLDTNGDGFDDAAAGWTLDRLDVAGGGPSIGSPYVGVYGKWNYVEEYGVFMGVIDPATGDVFIYKPLASAVPETDTAWMLLAGLAVVGGVAHRRRANRR